MSKLILNAMLLMVVLFLSSCNEANNSKIHLREEVGSDNIISNIVTRPVGKAFSALIGEGIEISDARLVRNKGGFLEVHVAGFNRSPSTRRFEYRVEWLDEAGLLLGTHTSTWLPVSAMGKSKFGFKSVSPRAEAIDFRIDTRK